MLSGIINVYKEKGYTSFDVVSKLRGILHIRRIGHTGTLDPAAEGVLPVCVGQATKAVGLLVDKDKTYRADMLLGITTDTQDMTGNIVAQREVSVSPDEVRDCIAAFIGEQKQVPPMYSAIKVGGRRLYELARSGREVERSPRDIVIYGIDIIQMHLPHVVMDIHCSKGTYIRTLCHDIGQRLKTGACMYSLLRTQAGPFRIEDAIKLDAVKECVEAGEIADILMPVDRVFLQYPAMIIPSIYSKPVVNGALITEEMISAAHHRELVAKDLVPMGGSGTTDAAKVRVYIDAGEGGLQFVGIYERHQDGYRPLKMFYDLQQPLATEDGKPLSDT